MMNQFVAGLLTGAALLTAASPAHRAADHRGWREYAGSSDSSQFSGLRQIDKSNVGRLEIAWTYPTGDNRKYSFNPIVLDGVMYVLAKDNSIVALDAASGREIWTWLNPAPDKV